MTKDNLPAEVAYNDPAMLDAIATELARQKLAAHTIEELNKVGRLVNASDLVGHELTVQSMRWANSTTEGGTGVFAILNAKDRFDQQHKSVAGGSKDIMATLVVLARLDAFPCVVKVVTVAKAKPGQNAPLGLEILPAELPF